MTVMLGYNNHKIWFTAFLLLIFAAGCSDPDKSGTNPTLSPPTVISVNPPSGAAGVCPNTVVIATFSKAMNPATVNAATFTVAPGVTGTITHDTTNTIFTFTPSSSLALNTLYTATITTAATDMFGNALASNFVWSFTTGANPCVAPTVISESPANGAVGVCLNTMVTATFDRVMNPATINATTFTLTGPGTTPVAGVVTYAASTATFTPSSSLALNTLYAATITTGAKDTFGNALASNFVWTFTTGTNPCTPPTVISESPANGAVGVCPNTMVTATFNRAMNPATINITTFLLAGPGNTPVAGVVTYNASSNTATFTPSSALALNTPYTATITTGAQDTFGNALASNFVWTFTTGSNPCNPPTVISVFPPNGAVGVCPNTVVRATFNRAMNPATINTTTFTVAPGVTGTITHDATSTIFTFTPTSSLSLSTLYTATITTGAQDTFGNALASNFVWSFTTGASLCTGPTVISETPPNGSTGVCENTVVTATFSEAMDPSTINTTTFLLTGPGITPVAGVVTYAASTATFTPNNPFALSTTYTATITTGAKDLFGIPLASNFVWTFTTSSTSCGAPTVISVAPPNGSSGVCENTVVTATFSEAMKSSTINTTTFLLTGPGVTPVAGAVTYVASSDVATFTPTSPLVLGTLYTATITTGAEDLAGVPLASDYVWTFATGSTPCISIVPLGTACSFGILAATPAVTNVGPTHVTGDVGIWPAASITGFPPGTLTGTKHAGDAVAATAQGDLTTAYNYAAGIPGGAILPADIGGETLPPGVYKTTSAQPSLGITGNLTLSGNANGVWIFQIVSTLTTAAGNSEVILSGGAVSENVFWQVGSSATLGTNTIFAGTIMAQASATVTTGATLNGRALARTGAVTLDDNLVTVPPCP